MAACGLSQPGDGVEAVMAARRLAGDVAAVRERFCAATASGLRPTHAMYATLAAAEAEAGSAESALAALDAAEAALGHEPRRVYKALLAVCVGCSAPPGLVSAPSLLAIPAHVRPAWRPAAFCAGCPSQTRVFVPL